MKKLTKLSLVAAVTVAGLMTSVNASGDGNIALTLKPSAKVQMDINQPITDASYIQLKTDTKITTAQTTVAGGTMVVAINDSVQAVPSLYAMTKIIKMNPSAVGMNASDSSVNVDHDAATLSVMVSSATHDGVPALQAKTDISLGKMQAKVTGPTSGAVMPLVLTSSANVVGAGMVSLTA